jgi:membrane protein
LLGWRDVLWRVWRQLGDDHLSIAAAGVAFYAMLAIFPAITAFVSTLAAIADPGQIETQFVALRGIIPADGWRLLNDQVHAVVTADPQSLGLGAALGFLIALWSAGAGVRASMTALNIAYREREKRGLVRFYGLALLFTFGIILAGLFSLGVIVAVPVALNLVELGPLGRLLLRLAPWTVLGLFVAVCLGIAYRYGPSRAEAKTRWISPGALLATLLWLTASVLFSVYVANFPSYNQTYGALGAAVVLMLWFWLSAYAMLFGAVLNAELEHQVMPDTTTGRPRPARRLCRRPSGRGAVARWRG